MTVFPKDSYEMMKVDCVTSDPRQRSIGVNICMTIITVAFNDDKL